MEKHRKWVKIASAETRDKTKILECIPLQKDIIADGIFINLSRQFYHIFRENIGKGIPIENLDIPDLTNLGPVLVNLHFSIELALKSLLLLKTGQNQLRKHDLKALSKKAAEFYPNIAVILNDPDCKNIINSLTKYFNEIRYGEVTICLNIDRVSDAPFQPFVNTTDKILQILWEAFRNNSL